MRAGPDGSAPTDIGMRTQQPAHQTRTRPVAPRPPADALRARTTVPVPFAHAVRRPRVERLLDDVARRRLTLVSAGPGWGKTTTTALWARSGPGLAVAWLTCEPHDATPAVFWSDVVAALRAGGAIPADHPLARRHIPAQVPPALHRQLLRDIESLPAPVALVLDEFHVLTSADVLGVVDDVLRYPLPLHPVLLCRADPVLDLHRLRVQGEITEVAAADLAFDADAVTALGALEGHALDRRSAERVLAETGGWAVGVRLHLDPAPGPGSRERTERSAAEYLVAEVLERQEPRMRRFLLRTSVTSAVCPELAATLDPGAPADRWLAELGTRNGFVTANGAHGTWYRYHPLLREMLQARLRVEDPRAARDAHRTAARWLAQDEPVEALGHAAACEDWTLFGEIFVDVAAACLAGPRRDALAEVLARVPYRTLAMDTALHLCAGALALVTDRPTAAHDHLARARRLLGPGDDLPVAAALLEVLDASLARWRGDALRMAVSGGAAVAAVERAPYPFPALDAYRSLATDLRLAGLAWCRAAGEVEEAATETRSLTRPDRVLDTGPGHDAPAVVALAVVAAGHPDAGAEAARAILAGAEAGGWSAHVRTRCAYAALGWHALLQGRPEEADRLLARGLAADAGGRDPASEVAVRLLQSLSASAQRRGRTARLALASADEVLPVRLTPPLLADLRERVRTECELLAGVDALAPEPPGAPSPSPAVAAVRRARTALWTGRIGAALDAADDALDQAGEDLLTRIEALLAEAGALAPSRNRRAGLAVGEALDLAAPGLLVLPFLTVPTPAVTAMLARATARRPDLLSQVLRARIAESPAVPEPAPLIEPLTEREIAVLGALPTMASNREIAEDFFVSVNTVKAHLKSLYRKLGVGSRRDAVRRGRELGLLA